MILPLETHLGYVSVVALYQKLTRERIAALCDAIGKRSDYTGQAPPSQGNRSWPAQGLHI